MRSADPTRRLLKKYSGPRYGTEGVSFNTLLGERSPAEETQW
jgi:hypothetical protein